MQPLPRPHLTRPHFPGLSFGAPPTGGCDNRRGDTSEFRGVCIDVGASPTSKSEALGYLGPGRNIDRLTRLESVIFDWWRPVLAGSGSFRTPPARQTAKFAQQSSSGYHIPTMFVTPSTFLQKQKQTPISSSHIPDSTLVGECVFLCWCLRVGLPS